MTLDKSINGSTMITGLIGNPVKHTFSPYLHNTFSKVLGINSVYLPFHVQPESLREVVNGLRNLNVLGFNVTIPYKQKIMPYLDEISEEANLIGAVNTVFVKQGRLFGYNTDTYGFAKSFFEETNSPFQGRRIVVIGAGGVARAIAIKVLLSGCEKLNILNRNHSKAVELAIYCNEIFGDKVQAYEHDAVNEKLLFSDSQIIINATSVGMHPDSSASPIKNSENIERKHIIYDTIYNPLKTQLMAQGEKKGAKVAGGLGMLFYQALGAFEIWNEINIDYVTVNDVKRLFFDMIELNS